MSVININDIHPLSCKWNLFSHLPHDTNWSLKSYEKIYFFENVEDVLDIYNILPDILIKNCMLFLMKDEINPIWEDPKNIKGGCWSLKIPKGNINEIWTKISVALCSETIINNDDLNINGISISPKKNFCIIKFWLNKNDNDIKKLNKIDNLNYNGIIFKAHNINR